MLNQDRKTKFTEQTKSELQEVAVNMTGCWLASCKLSGWHKQKFSCEKQEARSITILMDGITAPCGMFLTSWCKFADMKVTEPSESSPRPRANSISESISSTSQMNGRDMQLVVESGINDISSLVLCSFGTSLKLAISCYSLWCIWIQKWHQRYLPFVQSNLIKLVFTPPKKASFTSTFLGSGSATTLGASSWRNPKSICAEKFCSRGLTEKYHCLHVGN